MDDGTPLLTPGSRSRRGKKKRPRVPSSAKGTHTGLIVGNTFGILTGLIALIIGSVALGLLLNGFSTKSITTDKLYYQNIYRSNHTIYSSAQLLARKVKENIFVEMDDIVDDIASYTPNEIEEYRRLFVGGLFGMFGQPVGYKVALNAASPSTPALGYDAPQFGQVLEAMQIFNKSAVLRPDFAQTVISECEVAMRVGDAATFNSYVDSLNENVTEIMATIDAVYPASEAAGVPSKDGLPFIFGPGIGGNNLLPVLNGVARMFALADPIPIPGGSRTIEEWAALLNAPMNMTGTVVTPSGTTEYPTDNVTIPLQGIVKLIHWLKQWNYHVKNGDIIYTGTVNGVKPMPGNQQLITCTWYDLHPSMHVTQTVGFSITQGTAYAQRM